MEPSSTTNYSTTPTFSSSPPPTPLVLSPCAACKILRRRCTNRCMLAPYFPPHEPLKFTTAHRVFGASNIIKFLHELAENQRADAVSSMVYEANARIRDPVYGCAGAICQLQKQVDELQAELARAQAEIGNLQALNANLVDMVCMEKSQEFYAVTTTVSSCENSPNVVFESSDYFLVDDDGAMISVRDEPLWT